LKKRPSCQTVSYAFFRSRKKVHVILPCSCMRVIIDVKVGKGLSGLRLRRNGD
jgi:hypothetical protein